MHPSRWLAVAGATVALTIGSTTMAVSAFGDRGGGGGGDRHGGRTQAGSGSGKSQLDASLLPSLTSDPTLHGVMPGAKAWVLDRSELRVRADGRIEVRVRGLLLAGQTTPGPVTAISASLFCGADSDTTPAAATRQAPLSSSGNGRIRDRIAIPARCLAPIVLINPTLSPGTTPDRTHYIAVSGLSG